MGDRRTGTSAGTSRRERAELTRRRIVKAAYVLFAERGYPATTMADIAETAGVAVQTVYFAFHTKSALLVRAYDAAARGDDETPSSTDEAWRRAMAAEPEVAEALRWFVVGVGQATRRLAPVHATALAHATADPDLAAVIDRHERWQEAACRDALAVLCGRAPLREGVTRERAHDLLRLFAGVDVYRALVERSGWTHAAWVDWTVDALAEQLFGVRPVPRRRGALPSPLR